MNDWIKMQKIIMFIPGANVMPFIYNDIYYRKIYDNKAFSFSLGFSALWGILLIDIPLVSFLSVFLSEYAFWEDIKSIFLPYFVPLTMDYFMLRSQCKKFNVTPEEIGPKFYKFLLLKKPTAPTDNISDASCDTKQE